jgi:hypothetical protein
MATLSPAQANVVSLWFVVFLTALLALSLAAVIVSPSRAGSPPAEEADGEAGRQEPEPGREPPAAPLPRRVAGWSGVAYPAGGPARPPSVIRPRRVSGGPPWGSAPKPPRVPDRGKHRRPG